MKSNPTSPLRLIGAASVLLVVLATFWQTNIAGDVSARQPGGAEYQAVEQAINNVIGWAINKDFDLFLGTIADDTDFVSVTPYARVKIGFDEVLADTGFWASPDFKAVSHNVQDLKITFSKSGNVAWYYCVLNDYNTWKGQPANWENVRWTGVLEKREGKWRLVQQHFSWPKER